MHEWFYEDTLDSHPQVGHLYITATGIQTQYATLTSQHTYGYACDKMYDKNYMRYARNTEARMQAFVDWCSTHVSRIEEQLLQQDSEQNAS